MLWLWWCKKQSHRASFPGQAALPTHFCNDIIASAALGAEIDPGAATVDLPCHVVSTMREREMRRGGFESLITDMLPQEKGDSHK